MRDSSPTFRRSTPKTSPPPRCPFCLSSKAVWHGDGALYCPACEATIPPVTPRPLWERDPSAGNSFPDGGGIALWSRNQDAELELDIRARTERIASLRDTIESRGVARVEDIYRFLNGGDISIVKPRGGRSLPQGDAERLLLGTLLGMLWNLMVRLEGRDELVVTFEMRDEDKDCAACSGEGVLSDDVGEERTCRVCGGAKRRRASFAGHRAAIDKAFSVDQALLGVAPTFRTSARATNSLPSGVRLDGRMAVSPSRSGSSSARGEEALLRSLDARAAIEAARVGRMVSARGVVTDLGRPLSAVELDLVRLCDVGAPQRKAARRAKNGTMEPFFERMTIPEALERLRSMGHQGVPATEREAKIMLKRARAAITSALLERGLIEPRQQKPGAARQRPTQEHVEIIDPLEVFS